ncbi:type I-E CRISPR-associated protein Cse1/CasA [Streptomyces xanthochromogenes]|uniref:type I-E CRISPR-associated protein Cse1/CasA n=1 Tax=Streptomyces xanthochromogenes TaxID=67384 RepID=UPI003F4D57A4
MSSEQQAAGAGDLLVFDLTEQPWLPVLRTDGSTTELSLRQVFAQAGEIRRLVGDLPTQDFALLRLLLAILHDAVDGPEETEQWADLWEAEAPFASVGGYLDTHRERFDLLHPAAPFFQTAGLRTSKDEVFSLNRIVADVPNGDAFFTMRFPGAERITFAEAARWTVHVHGYDTSGIKTGTVGDPRARAGKAYPQGVGWAGSIGGVLAEGRTLRETLLLNLIAADAGVVRTSGEDRPVWRREPCGPGAASDLAGRPHGVRDLYTWQSRRLRLHFDAQGVYGVVLSYGDPLSVQDRQTQEPMTGWRRSQAQEKKLGRPLVYMPREHDPARAAWRGLAALIADRDQDTSAAGEPANALRPGIVHWLAHLTTERFLPKDTLVRLHTFGAVYGTQQSVTEEITEDGVAVALVLLHETDRRLGQCAIDAVADADNAVKALGNLAGDLARAAGSEGDASRSAAFDLGYAGLDHSYRTWLSSLADGDDPQDRRAEWQRLARAEIRALGRQLIAQAGRKAWAGRLVSGPKGEVWLCSDQAALWFAAGLNRALPLAAPAADPAVVSEADASEPPKVHA